MRTFKLTGTHGQTHKPRTMYVTTENPKATIRVMKNKKMTLECLGKASLYEDVLHNFQKVNSLWSLMYSRVSIHSPTNYGVMGSTVILNIDTIEEGCWRQTPAAENN